MEHRYLSARAPRRLVSALVFACGCAPKPLGGLVCAAEEERTPIDAQDLFDGRAAVDWFAAYDTAVGVDDDGVTVSMTVTFGDPFYVVNAQDASSGSCDLDAIYPMIERSATWRVQSDDGRLDVAWHSPALLIVSLGADQALGGRALLGEDDGMLPWPDEAPVDADLTWVPWTSLNPDGSGQGGLDWQTNNVDSAWWAWESVAR